MLVFRVALTPCMRSTRALATRATSYFILINKDENSLILRLQNGVMGYQPRYVTARPCSVLSPLLHTLQYNYLKTLLKIL